MEISGVWISDSYWISRCVEPKGRSPLLSWNPKGSSSQLHTITFFRFPFSSFLFVSAIHVQCATATHFMHSRLLAGFDRCA